MTPITLTQKQIEVIMRGLAQVVASEETNKLDAGSCVQVGKKLGFSFNWDTMAFE